MFLRKLFRTENKLAWVLIDLIIVIIGVYSAFLIQNYATEKSNTKEREKVYSALKYELEFFRFLGPEMSSFMKDAYVRFDSIRDKGQVADFSNWIYIQPQYSYQIVEYAINLQGNEVIDFQMQQLLQNLYVEIKRLEYAERKIEEFSNEYASIPLDLDSKSPEVTLLKQKNRDNFEWFLTYFSARGGILARTGEVASEALPLINQRLDPIVRRNIEEDLITSQLKRFSSAEGIIPIIMKQFPDFTEEDIRQMSEKTKDSNPENK
jgi:hypothetical protein